MREQLKRKHSANAGFSSGEPTPLSKSAIGQIVAAAKAYKFRDELPSAFKRRNQNRKATK